MMLVKLINAINNRWNWHNRWHFNRRVKRRSYWPVDSDQNLKLGKHFLKVWSWYAFIILLWLWIVGILHNSMDFYVDLRSSNVSTNPKLESRFNKPDVGIFWSLAYWRKVYTYRCQNAENMLYDTKTVSGLNIRKIKRPNL